MQPSTERLRQSAAMFVEHDAQLHRLVERRGSPEHATRRRLRLRLGAAAAHIDLGPPRWHALAWLTTVAIHEAWRMNRIDRRAGTFDPATLDAISIGRERAVAAAYDVAEQHMRLRVRRGVQSGPGIQS